MGDFFWSGIGPNGILAADNETLQSGSGLFTFGHTNGAVLPTGSGTVARFVILVGEQVGAANLSITLSDVMLLNGTEAYSVETITDATVELRCMTSVPDLRGLSLTEATSALQTAHLSAGTVSETDNSSGSLSLNVVLEQSTPAGTSVLCGSSVNLTINTPPTITVSNVSNGATYTADVTPDIVVTDTNLGTYTVTLNSQSYAVGTAITVNGSYTLTVTAEDLLGNRSTLTVTFTLAKYAPIPLAITTTGLASGIVNHPYTQTLCRDRAASIWVSLGLWRSAVKIQLDCP